MAVLSTVDRTELLLRTPLFRDLSEHDVAELSPNLRERSFGRGQTVWVEGDPDDAVYIVAEGQFKSYRVSSDGREVILALHFGGTLTGDGPEPMPDIGESTVGGVLCPGIPTSCCACSSTSAGVRCRRHTHSAELRSRTSAAGWRARCSHSLRSSEIRRLASRPRRHRRAS